MAAARDSGTISMAYGAAPAPVSDGVSITSAEHVQVREQGPCLHIVFLHSSLQASLSAQALSLCQPI